VGRLLIVACACVLLAACSTASYEGDPEATQIAQSQYSLCLAASAARLDDGHVEVATIGRAVAGACYAQFVRIQIADGDAAREESQRVYSPASALLMHKQDDVEQALLAKQAVLANRHRVADVATNAASPATANSVAN